MAMTTLTYRVSFNTPAFLGNAEQQAQWRTPPFKALLRQWWRVVKAPELGFNHHQLLQKENALFGAAADDGAGGSHRSLVQLRLSGWEVGSILAQRDAVELNYVEHSEVDPRQFPPQKGEKKVRADVYLGYGPIGKSAAINTSTVQTLQIRCPESEEADVLQKAMQLAAWFGTLGSRSRNGWGSLHIQGEGLLGYQDLSESALLQYAAAQPLGDALRRDWPHGIATCADTRPAVWIIVSGNGFQKWESVMEHFAKLKIAFRTQFNFNNQGAPHNAVLDRHILAYPVTYHGLQRRDPTKPDKARLANQMRFKVAKDKSGNFFGIITHLPCAMPNAFFAENNLSVHPPGVNQQIEVWQQVHHFLNSQPKEQLTRIRKG